MKLTDEQKDKLYNDWRDQGSDVSYGDLMDAIESEVLRLNGITGDGRGDSPCKGCQYEREDVAFQICVDCELSDYSLRSPVTVPAFKRVPLVSQCSRCGYETIATPPQQQQAAPGAVPDGFVLVPVVATQEMISAVCDCHDIDHREEIAANYAAMLSAAPKPQEPGA